MRAAAGAATNLLFAILFGLPFPLPMRRMNGRGIDRSTNIFEDYFRSEKRRKPWGKRMRYSRPKVFFNQPIISGFQFCISGARHRDIPWPPPSTVINSHVDPVPRIASQNVVDCS